MPIQAVKLSQTNDSYFKKNIMLLGKHDTGKTVFSLGSQIFRTCHFDIDAYGNLSAKCFRGNPQLGIPPINQDLVTSIQVNAVDEIFDAIKYLEQNIKNFDLCVVDTITDYQRMVVNDLVGSDHANLKDYEWGPVLNTMNQVTQKLKRLPVHIIYNAHESEFKRSTVINGKQIQLVTPAFDGQFLDIYQTHFSEIWRYIKIPQWYIGEDGLSHLYEHRYIQCQPDETFQSKDRTSILDKYEPPYIDAIFAKIQYYINGGK